MPSKQNANVALSLRRVAFSYQSNGVGFHDLSLDVTAGEVFGILGPSGAGKSTLLRLLGGHLFPNSGSILIDGSDLSRIPPEERPTATVFQELALFPHMNVEENVLFGVRRGGRRKLRPEDHDTVEHLLDELHVKNLRLSMPATLSGGEMQRVAIARALATQPRILLMDEPFSALDVSSRRQAKQLIHDVQARHGITIVIVSHDQDDILATCDHVAVLAGFKCEQVATPKELLDHPASRAVVSYLEGFTWVDFASDVVPFFCHRSAMRIEADRSMRLNGPVVTAKVSRVSRRLDSVELELRSGEGSSFVAYWPLDNEELHIGQFVTVAFHQQVRLETLSGSALAPCMAIHLLSSLYGSVVLRPFVSRTNLRVP